MTDRPILFSAPMIRAILDGCKSQTRRILEPQPTQGYAGETPYFTWGKVTGLWPDDWQYAMERNVRVAVGDRLYVREHWRTTSVLDAIAPRDLKASENHIVDYTPIHYEADGSRKDYHPHSDPPFGKHRQAMHMPKWASRITLIVEGVKVERLQDISEADAIAEGAPLNPNHRDGTEDGSNPYMVRLNAWTSISPVAWYHRLWNDINGPGSWEANPWVAAYTFTVHHQNIDQIERAAA